MKATVALAEKEARAHVQYRQSAGLRKGMGGWKSTIRGRFSIPRSSRIWTSKRSGKVCKLLARFEPHDGQSKDQLRTPVLLLSFSSVQTFASAVQGHWGSESRLHGVLDVAL